MGKGKTAAQVAHAAILACNETRIANSNWLKAVSYTHLRAHET